MKAVLTRNALPEGADRFFPSAARELFHEPALLSIFSSDWYGCLITDGDKAFLNCVMRDAIPGTAHFDINPFMGYAGPVANTDDTAFLKAALSLYSEKCRELNIVAELMRFSPLLDQASRFIETASMKKIMEKKIVIVPCRENDEAQLHDVTSSCRRSVEAGKKRFIFRELTPPERPVFYKLYADAMMRAKAEPCWHFSYTQMNQLAEQYTMYGVFDGAAMQSACLVAHHVITSHYMLAASNDAYEQGAGELLVFGAIRAAASLGRKQIVLGGGVTQADDDALLRFKKKFTPQISQFCLAGMVHDSIAFNQLVSDAERRQPELASRPYFLKYRLLNT